ncbi:hypothetical protein QBC36DRAFT_234086 [Triangularia setosa]|uniref:RING-type E3 ubiquitin transferase n=1 Tax=Triangularia setosa TaxID=2587417 RepID=A0AAN7AA12_9PEZI|nr:hypothetical protein QBC36DRAFT_234086 [Podospora setosa]
MEDISGERPPTMPVPPSDNNPKEIDIKSQILQLTLTEIKSSDSDDNPCVICLETITSPSTALPCAHSNFDFLCLVSWLQQQSFCPLCKASVTQVRYTDTEFQKENVYKVPPPPAASREQEHVFRIPEGYIAIPEPNFTAWSSRRRGQNNRRPPTRRSDNDVDQALERRRYIYRHNLYSLHIGSSRHTSYSPSIPPPQILSSTPHLLSKARLFLRRELQVFFPLTSSRTPDSGASSSQQQQNREFLLEYIIAVLKTVDLQSESGAAHAHTLLQDYMLFPDTGEDRTALFLHELKNWMRWRGHPVGNVSLESWDQGVQYPSLGSGNKRRHHDGEDDIEPEEEQRGYSWTDETGDHWRPGHPDRGHGGREEDRKRGQHGWSRKGRWTASTKEGIAEGTEQ